MRPEDLGIKGFTPAPETDHGAVLVKTAATMTSRVKALTVSAEAIVRENATMRGTVTRLSAELFHVRAALEEARRHRTILFVLGLLLVAVLLAR